MKNLFPDSIGNYREALWLTDKLRAYWAGEGSQVSAWVETSGTPDKPFYSMRSNMINGLPRPKAE